MRAPDVQAVQTPDDFQAIVQRARGILSGLTPIDYEAAYVEMGKLNVPGIDSPTLQHLNGELQAIQGCKDRLLELAVQALKNHNAHRTVCAILREGWPKFSLERSQDKRDGEAILKMAGFVEAASEAETFYRAVSLVAKNLDDKQDSVSRQISCYHLMLKLRDGGRATPDFDPFPPAQGRSDPAQDDPAQDDPAQDDWSRLPEQ
jgi:hypothetical protein